MKINAFRLQVIGLGVALVPFTAGISTISAVKGNAGGPALVYDMRGSADAHRAYFETAIADASGADSARTALEPLVSTTCDLAGLEGSKGIVSGSAGKAGVYAAFTTVCKNGTAIIATLADTVSRNAARREAATVILAEMEDIPNDTTLNVFERQAAFRVKVNALFRLVDASGTENVAARLKAQLDILEASVITLGTTGGSFGAKQSGVIASLKESVGQVGAIVQDLTAATERNAPPPSKLLDMGAAVAAHWAKTLPAILIAVLADTMPIWFTAYLMVVTARLDRLRHSQRNRRERLCHTDTSPKSDNTGDKP